MCALALSPLTNTRTHSRAPPPPRLLQLESVKLRAGQVRDVSTFVNLYNIRLTKAIVRIQSGQPATVAQSVADKAKQDSMMELIYTATSSIISALDALKTPGDVENFELGPLMKIAVDAVRRIPLIPADLPELLRLEARSAAINARPPNYLCGPFDAERQGAVHDVQAMYDKFGSLLKDRAVAPVWGAAGAGRG